jgi:hypothetical protein
MKKRQLREEMEEQEEKDVREERMRPIETVLSDL